MDKLPPELRLLIYPHLLHFDTALTRPAEEAQDEQLIDISILCASKTIYTEATETFYNNNTFTFKLTRVCRYHKKKKMARKHLLVPQYGRIQLMVDRTSSPVCGVNCLLSVLYSMRNAVYTRKLQSILIRLLDRQLWHIAKTLEERLRKNGLVSRYSEIGRFGFIDPSAGASLSQPRIEFEIPAIIKACAYFAALPPGAPELHRFGRKPDALEALSRELVQETRKLSRLNSGELRSMIWGSEGPSKTAEERIIGGFGEQEWRYRTVTEMLLIHMTWDGECSVNGQWHGSEPEGCCWGGVDPATTRG